MVQKQLSEHKKTLIQKGNKPIEKFDSNFPHLMGVHTGTNVQLVASYMPDTEAVICVPFLLYGFKLRSVDIEFESAR